MSLDPAETFRQEAQELLEGLEQTLLDLEHTPDDFALLDAAFRALHTIKGSGAMFGFEAVAAFTHHVETALDALRRRKGVPGPSLIAAALAAKDHIRALINEPASASEEQAAAILRLLDEPTGPASAPEAPKTTAWRIRMRFAKDVMEMGTNPLLLLDELRDLGQATVVAVIDTIPPLVELVPTECHIGWDVVLTTDKGKGAIEDVFIFVIDDMTLEIEALSAPVEAPRIGEILIDRGDVAPAAVREALAQQEPLGKLLVEAGIVSENALTSGLAEQNHLRREAQTPKPVAAAAASVRVPTERLDELMDRVGELVIAQSRLKQLALNSTDSQIKAVAEDIERLALELRDTTMGVRMVPIGTLFSRFRRLVHDLGRDLGKEVEFIALGEETELDKTVIERLNDPLVHLVRNAIDHGLEPPDVRLAAGKSAKGRITLAAEHVGSQVIISITDDGRGLNRERIRQRAEEQGLVPAGAKLSDAELFQMIFHSGFSTAAQVTNVSGRGVGMDVVKRTIEALRGSIEIGSRPGAGSEILLRLPLTLAIIEGMLVRVGAGRYVIPLTAVEECFELSTADDARSKGRSFLNIRGDLVPFLRLRDSFKCTVPQDPFQKVVIVRSGEQRVGLVVDQVIGDHQTVIKSLTKLHSGVKDFSGATILGDGEVALILNIPHLVENNQGRDDRLRMAG
ncbi:chemotaxis protein CheA [Lacibacterium aquatile]|uniref:Chemotaxis protein CheA n=1 Tax=Lacibacterium aquatile TaxID=1168082 RepID=A0ABW5DML8_9PROT